MQSILIDNSRKTHRALIFNGLTNANQIFMCTAFLKSSGFQLIRENLAAALKRGATIKLVVGLDFYLTDPGALWDAFELLSANKKSSLMICGRDQCTFHPKLYCWVNDKTVTVLIGSANLTAGGLENNVELSVAYTGPRSMPLFRDVKRFMSMIESDPRVRPASAVRISRYERQHQVYSAKMKKAKSEAEDEIKRVAEINPERLERYLRAYENDKEQRSSWQDRVADYKKARHLLSELAKKRETTRGEFLRIYAQLVGQRGKGSLWHSSGLARMKNKVARKHKLFQSMVGEVRRLLDEPTSKVLDAAVRRARRIEGLGLNVITEMLNAFAPKRFAVLNKNSVSSLRKLGFGTAVARDKQHFSSAKYVQFNDVSMELARDCGFKDLSQVDHFLNFIYWRYVKSK